MIRLLLAVALVGGTVHTGEGPALESATVLISGNRIQAVGRNLRIPADARVIDVSGRIVTPGLIDASSRLGVEEVSLEATAVEATLPEDADPVRASLRVADSFDPASQTLPVARAGGVTSTVAIPAGGLISGISVWADLARKKPLRRSELALHVRIATGEQPGARAAAFVRLREAFDDARLYHGNRGPYIARRLRDLSLSAADLDVLRRALDGELRVVFHVDRAADIATVLAIAREYALRPVLAGAAEAWELSETIAKLDVPVLLDPLQNLPAGFSSLQSRADNALILHRAGVRVAFTQLGEAHLVHRLRELAGNAVAGGFPYDAALAAITRVPAQIFGIKELGVLRPGAEANLVVWSGDPFEPTSFAERVFVRGRQVDLTTRQDLLTRRYLRGPLATPAPATRAGTP